MHTIEAHWRALLPIQTQSEVHLGICLEWSCCIAVVSFTKKIQIMHQTAAKYSTTYKNDKRKL